MSDERQDVASEAKQAKELVWRQKEAARVIKGTPAPRNEPKSLNPIEQENLDRRRSDRKLRETYAKRFLLFLAAQLIVMNIVFVATGLGWLKYKNRWTLELYMGGTLAEVFGIVVIVTRSLFPSQDSKE